jgi:hypothetical protein
MRKMVVQKQPVLIAAAAIDDAAFRFQATTILLRQTLEVPEPQA